MKDTSDFINKINDIGNIPLNSYLVTMDVKSLYTNITNLEGIVAVKNAYDNHPNKSIATKVITTFLASILTLNMVNIIFKSNNVPWPQYSLPLTLIFSWQASNQNIYNFTIT